MEELMIPTGIALLVAAVAIFLVSAGYIRLPGWMRRPALRNWVRRIKSPLSPKKSSPLKTVTYQQPDMGVLNCRAQLTRLKEDNNLVDVFVV